MPASLAVLALIEVGLAFLAVYAAVLLRFQTRFSHLSNLERELGPLWPRGLVFSAIVGVCLLAFGLYSSRQRAPIGGIFLRLAVALVVASCAIAAVFYLIPSLHLWRGVAALAVLGTGCAVLISRLVFASAVDQEIFKRRVLVYGAGAAAASVANLRRSADRRGFLLTGFVCPPDEDPEVPAERLLDASGGLRELCERLNVSEVVVAMDDRRRGFPLRELLQCRLAGVDVTELLSFLERETGRVRIDVLNPSWMIFGHGFRRDPLRLFSSRTMDLLASLAVLAVSLPFMLLTLIAIKIEDGWRAPALYSQCRVGRGGRTFRVLKFRSMRLDAELEGAQWAQRQDPRVTRVGAIIRKLRVDELPQVINVLRGHMSFVGPRPERPEFVAHLAEEIPYYVQRHCVKPGITGWAQVNGWRGETDTLEKIQRRVDHDLYYIEHWSLMFDIKIVLMTILTIMRGRNAW